MAKVENTKLKDLSDQHKYDNLEFTDISDMQNNTLSFILIASLCYDNTL